MVLIRAAYSKIFPELDRILSIDMDTVVNENISDLWDLDLTDYYLAAVEE
jgi:lipopolysaccharide biosynthesis glycosyltransferase